MDWYPDDSTTSPPVYPGAGLLGVVSVVEEERGRLACCCGSVVFRRRGAWGLPLRRGSRSPLPDPDPLLRRLCRLVPRLIMPTAAEPWPAAEGTTGAERQSESGQQDPQASSGAVEEVPPADTTEEDEEEDDEVMVDREKERRLRCWNSCFNPWPRTPMLSLAFRLILLKDGCSDWDEALFSPEHCDPSACLLAPGPELRRTPSGSL